ncbi:MarR family transcriptional regulator [Actinopolymorpha sp. B17G11]|uniref:MarR family winged helix-turn-helix transcriptional regulator n=1 Tax=Actinopolymorpha sp. B17G11 TaxID=3160861 RepID=UPI0032E4CF87
MQAVHSSAADRPGLSRELPRDTPEALLVALMRMIRLIKRTQPTAIEPALQYVLYTVNCAGPLRLSDLAEQVQLDVSTVSRHARALETSGYLQRTVDPDDRRAAHLSVTNAGRQVLDDAFARRRANLDAALADWPEGDLHTLERLLNRLADDLEHQSSRGAGTGAGTGAGPDPSPSSVPPAPDPPPPGTPEVHDA